MKLIYLIRKILTLVSAIVLSLVFSKIIGLTSIKESILVSKLIVRNGLVAMPQRKQSPDVTVPMATREVNRTEITNLNEKEKCPLESPYLVRRIQVNSTYSPSYAELEKMFPWISLGGRYEPDECVSDKRIAIIIPHRNRDSHLRTLLYHLFPFLKKQRFNFAVYVVNQGDNGTFNKGILMNVAFSIIRENDNCTCYIFHDVDLIPEDNRNIYGCFENPRHLSVLIDKFLYRAQSYLFGGVTAFTREQFERVNGFSNYFFGWGGEDDDMLSRIRHRRMSIVIHNKDKCRYTMIKHKRDEGNRQNPLRFGLLRNTKSRIDVDGLNSLHFRLQAVEVRKLFTWISVLINEKEVMLPFWKESLKTIKKTQSSNKTENRNSTL